MQYRNLGKSGLKVSAYIDIAKDHNLDPTKLAIAWCLLNKKCFNSNTRSIKCWTTQR